MTYPEVEPISINVTCYLRDWTDLDFVTLPLQLMMLQKLAWSRLPLALG